MRRGVLNLINWGCSQGRFDGHIINPFSAVAVSGNKLATFNRLRDHETVKIPEFTSDREHAATWFDGGSRVVCRTTLHGHSGAGIVLADIVDQLVDAPLYVRYVKKQKEFRVHVAFGEVIDVQEKRQRADVPEGFIRNFQVRNHHTGWVYCRENIEEPGGLRGMALAAVESLGLDFGAVDIIYNKSQDALYVLEVNCAPGLQGHTVEVYTSAFIKQIKSYGQ